jgi:hypothetical protein
MAVYPPVTKVPPAEMISVKAPPPMLISNTPPSQVLGRVLASKV